MARLVDDFDELRAGDGRANMISLSNNAPTGSAGSPV